LATITYDTLDRYGWDDGGGVHARARERSIECGPTDPDRDALPTYYHCAHNSPAFRPAASYARVDDRADPHHTRRQHAHHQPASARHPPALIATAGERAARRFLEFFAANIRNPRTRRPYAHVVAGFMTWCDDNRVGKDHHRAAAARRRLDRASDARTCGTDRQATPGALRHLFD
jgi:hypothetical protein